MELDEWENLINEHLISADEFLTMQTSQGSRVTLRSAHDMADYLTSTFNFTSVITCNVNQDCLEVCWLLIYDLHGVDITLTWPYFFLVWLSLFVDCSFVVKSFIQKYFLFIRFFIISSITNIAIVDFRIANLRLRSSIFSAIGKYDDLQLTCLLLSMHILLFLWTRDHDARYRARPNAHWRCSAPV